MKILAIIPARKGSKSIPDKNIKLINNIPLLAHSIIHAKESKLINRIIVSTDSVEYASIALKYGAEIPFIRPDNISNDDSLDIDVFIHAIDFFIKNENYYPDYIVHLRPTHPFRNSSDIDNMLRIIIQSEDVDSVRSVVRAKNSPFKMWFMKDDNTLEPILNNPYECYNMPRQKLPYVYQQNASIDVIRTSSLVNKKSMTGNKILGYEMNYDFDIDNFNEFEYADKILSAISNTNKKYVFDIDGVIASITKNNDYKLSKPLTDNIKIINDLFDEGNEIVLFTARGYKSGLDWKDHTITQLNKWGVKFHTLLFGKPNADYYIDDKSLDINILKKIANIKKGE